MQNWSRFEEEVDNVVPLAVNRIYLDSSLFILSPIIRHIGNAHVIPSPKKNNGAHINDFKESEQADDLTSDHDSDKTSSDDSDKETKETHNTKIYGF